ncbi:DUF2147 domain-containing protein [Massilia sp. H-1]|nr:DUF2147 domain-containing protein [Massilia sp. H-1]
MAYLDIHSHRLRAGAAAFAGQEAATGLWLSADKAAVIEFKACTDLPSALCGTIVWDKDA